MSIVRRRTTPLNKYLRLLRFLLRRYPITFTRFKHAPRNCTAVQYITFQIILRHLQLSYFVMNASKPGTSRVGANTEVVHVQYRTCNLGLEIPGEGSLPNLFRRNLDALHDCKTRYRLNFFGVRLRT